MTSAIVWRVRTLGDVILSLPLLGELRRSGDVRVIGYPDAWEPVGELIDRIDSVEDPAFKRLFEGRVSPSVKHGLAGVDQVLAITTRDIKPVLDEAGVPHVRQIVPCPPRGLHMAEWLLGRRCVTRPRFRPDSNSRRVADTLIKTLGLSAPVVIHPGSAMGWKVWPPDRFARLADVLKERGYEVALVSGPGDASVVESVRAQQKCATPAFPPVSVRILAAILARSALYVGNDSGVTHLAAAAGTPTIALFGPTDPANWKPLGDVTVIRRCAAQADGSIRACIDDDCMTAISVVDVLDAVAIKTCAALPTLKLQR